MPLCRGKRDSECSPDQDLISADLGLNRPEKVRESEPQSAGQASWREVI